MRRWRSTKTWNTDHIKMTLTFLAETGIRGYMIVSGLTPFYKKSTRDKLNIDYRPTIRIFMKCTRREWDFFYRAYMRWDTIF